MRDFTPISDIKCVAWCLAISGALNCFSVHYVFFDSTILRGNVSCEILRAVPPTGARAVLVD